jgi:hypothetical protein
LIAGEKQEAARIGFEPRAPVMDGIRLVHASGIAVSQMEAKPPAIFVCARKKVFTHAARHAAAASIQMPSME